MLKARALPIPRKGSSRIPKKQFSLPSCCSCYSQKSKSQVWKSLIAAFSLYIKEVREGKGRGTRRERGRKGRAMEGEGERKSYSILFFGFQSFILYLSTFYANLCNSHFQIIQLFSVFVLFLFICGLFPTQFISSCCL